MNGRDWDRLVVNGRHCITISRASRAGDVGRAAPPTARLVVALGSQSLIAGALKGLASATPQRTRARREVFEVATLRISEKGRRSLAATGSRP